MTMNEAEDLTGCEKLTALRVALNRPASLRKAIARSPIDASRLGASASREASCIAYESYIVDDVHAAIVPLPSPDALDAAFLTSMTRHEEVTARIRACLALSREPPQNDMSLVRGDIRPSQLTVTNLA